MGGGEGEDLGSWSEVPGSIFKIINQDSLCRPDNFFPAGVSFFQSVTPSVGPLFVPLKKALREDHLPDLLWGRREESLTPHASE